MKKLFFFLIAVSALSQACNNCIDTADIRINLTVQSNGQNVSPTFEDKSIHVIGVSFVGQSRKIELTFAPEKELFSGYVDRLCIDYHSTYAIHFGEPGVINTYNQTTNLDTLDFIFNEPSRDDCNDCSILEISSRLQNSEIINGDEIDIFLEL